MTNRLCFLSHFVICLAVAAGAFFATINGIPQLIYANDLSHMTSVIAAIFLASAGWLGWQSWRAGEAPPRDVYGRFVAHAHEDAALGRLAEKLCVRTGLAGTVIGLSMQAKALASGAAGFGALATSLYPTVVGIVASSLVAILVHNLASGAARMRQ